LSLLLTLIAFALSITALGVALLRARTGVLISWLALGISLSPTAVGVVGMQLARAHIDQVLRFPDIDPSQRERIRELGYQEAESCVIIGAALSTPPMMFSLIALAIASTRRWKAAVNGQRSA
jgi:hypothetical protein